MKKWGKNFNESTISMILGAVVVIIIGVIAYSYFRSNQTTLNPGTTSNIATTSGQVGTSLNAVALPVTHTVASGENLWVIAEKYFKSGYNFVDIAAANGLANPSQIDVGQKLTIPKVSVREPLTVTSAQAPTITQSRIEGGTYTVVRGDDLWNIALRAYGDGYRWVDIAKANSLANPGLIFSDNVLTLPRP